MKKIVKLNLCICLVGMLSLMMMSAHAASTTGHEEFQKITFLHNDYGELLVDMDDEVKQKVLDSVKRKFFGWSVKTRCHNSKVVYEAGSIFSRSNNTKQTIELDYSTSTKTTKQLSVNVSGSITLKLSGKIDQVSASLDDQIRTEIGVKNEVVFQEGIDFSIIIAPGKKVSLLVKGIATLSNGASKYYVMGIPVKKGYWEYVDVENEYYELFEEDILY